MEDRHDRELAVAIAEGIVGRSDAAIVAREARRRHLSPFAVLLEQGRISPDSLPSLQAALAEPERSHATLALSSTDIGLPPPAVIRDQPPAFPVPGWDRYIAPRLLGQGGMGTVFAASDPRLRREVAIKFVRGDNPEHARRLIVEARAQARVRHACVCEIHEVGEVDGKVYIAMQYVAGKPLGQLASELTVEQAAMLIRGAALGLHEAHRAGVIHRDVKPSNILVEQSDTGELRPYVVDFGLARAVYDDGAHGATLSGTILGTPRYMAPEQARGGAAGVDRRADIYGLGATLYYLLTGEPPIAGNTPIEAMANLLTTEPRPVRAITPGVPADLEAIVLKCLEKDRADRYDSARALADDLGRFLDGAPVMARPAGVWYRVRKHLARHRRLVAAGAAALTVTLAAAGWALATRAQASEREHLAQRFTEMVERIEAMARYSALSPLHDIRPDQAAMRARMAELETEIHRAGSIAAGPGHYALGRGYLALDEDEHARGELEAAWQAGYREPRVAYALALALGHLYQQAARAAERIEDKQQRARKHREVEHQLREPALAYLQASRGAEVPSEAYVAALTAYYGGKLDEALHELDRVGAEVPWFYEAAQLRGDILLTRARQLRDEGKEAQTDFDEGRRAYTRAAAIGESVATVHESLGELEYAALAVALYRGGDVESTFERCLAATSRALAIVSDDYDSLALTARARRSLAEYRIKHGSAPADLLATGIRVAQRAAAIAPARPQAWLELARLYRQWAEYLVDRALDPSVQLAGAVAAAERIRAEDRDASYYSNLGLLFKIWADYQDDAGGDAQANRAKAIAAFSRALELNDKLNAARINLGINYFERARQPGTADRDGDLRRAMQAMDAALAVDLKHVVPYFYAGKIYTLMATRDRARGIDPGPDLAHALDMYRAGLAIDSQLPDLHSAIGLALIDQAKQTWEAGHAPEPLLDQAQAAFKKAISVAPDLGFPYGNMGVAWSWRARFAQARGQDPTASLRAAVAALNQGLARIPDQPAFRAELGLVHAMLAAHALDSGQDPRPDLDRATAAIQRALAKAPREATAQRALGETRAIAARLHVRENHEYTKDFEAAAQALMQAIDRAPDELDHQLALARLYGTWAQPARRLGTVPDALLDRGLVIVDRVLGIAPSSPSARIVRATLLLQLAEASASTTERVSRASQSAADFENALATNAALRSLWMRDAKHAKQLASAQP